MFPVYKLERLPAGQRRRKIVMLLKNIENACSGEGYGALYEEIDIRALVHFAIEDPKLNPVVIPGLEKLLAAGAGSLDIPRICNYTRHALLSAIGNFPAEWDLVIPDKKRDGHKQGAQNGNRFFYSGVSVYAEDIRSPFNLGSIFRTAEAFGAEKVMISPLCVPPSHPRAQRSAMGCIEYIPWEQNALESIPQDVSIFALETGGIPLCEFRFPLSGVVLIGSEELGLSPEALSRANYGRVSIPMKGIKASLNVGVAFGILMQAWTSYLRCSASNPF